MVRFNDKSQILDSDISNNDIIPITDMDAPEDDKKITVGQLKSFISGGQSDKANVDFTNTKMITDSIISAPNGIFEASNNNQAITVKSELQLVFADGRDDETGRYAIAEHVTSQDITQSIITLSDGIYELFLTDDDTILFVDQDSVYVSEDAPQIIKENAYWYNLIDNYWKATSNYGVTWSTANIASLGTVEIANNRVSSTKPNQLLGIISFEVFKKMTQQEQRPGALEICDIGTALYVDESKGLRRYLNGSILNINNNTKAFVERLKEIRTINPDYFTTEEDWQNEATENIDGCVYKFVIDEENETVRLPKYPEYVEISDIIESLQTNLKLKYFIQISTGVEVKADIINEIQLNNPVTIFEFKWSDHILNNLSWLRADTFSWHSGDVYVTAYNKLVEEYNNGTEESFTSQDKVTIFRRSANGFKITTAEYEQDILDNYNLDGVCWYYILDTENRRFKLPRTKWGFKGLRDGVGDAILESLPNITGSTLNAFSTTDSNIGALTNTETISTYGVAVSTSNSLKGRTIHFDASRSSSVYQDGAPVQERGTQMYLYFYVGETVQNAKLIDVGRTNEILNNKVDIDNLQEVSIVIESYIDPDTPTNGYRIWSDGYCEQWGYIANSGSYSTNAQTISFAKTFKDANYDLQITCNRSTANTTSTAIREIGYQNKYANSFTKISSSNTDYEVGFDWKASGYLAEGEY